MMFGLWIDSSGTVWQSRWRGGVRLWVEVAALPRTKEDWAALNESMSVYDDEHADPYGEAHGLDRDEPC